MLQCLTRNAAREGPRILRFVATGLLNTAFGYSVYLAGLWLGLVPMVALAVATVTSALFNYLSISTLVFRASTIVNLPAFAVAYIVIYLFNAALLHMLILVQVAPWLAQILALPPVVIANYALMRLWVFRNVR